MNYVKNKLKNYLRFKKTFSELSSMSDRDLADIGISRHDIKRIAVESVNV